MTIDLTDNKQRKKIWIVIWVFIAIALICFGLIIWGIVELIIHQGYYSDILGGLLIGVPGFLLILIMINISSFIINNVEFKKDISNFFNKKKDAQQEKEE